MTAINLTEQALRVLWPASPGRRGRGRSSDANRPSVSAATEFSLSLPPRTVGPFSARDFRWKFVFGGAAKLKAPLLNGAQPTANQFGLSYERRTDGTNQIAAKYEREITDGITAEMGLELSEENFNQVSEKIASGNWSGAMQDMFNMKIKGGIPLTQNGASSLNLEFDLAADPHLCFFGATGKLLVALPMDGVSGLDLPRGYTVELESTNTVRFGLTEAGWTRVARIVGGPAIRAATTRIAHAAAQQAVRSALSAAGIWAVAIAGTLAITYVTAELCSAARSEGYRWGVLSGYCTGYLSRLQFAHARGHDRRTIQQYVNGSTRRQLGWRDATRAITASSLRQVERTVIRHFGSDYDIEVFDSIVNWEQRVSNVRSRVGSTVDSRSEVHSMALNMSRYLASEIDEVAAYLGRVNAGGFIRSTNEASQRI